MKSVFASLVFLMAIGAISPSAEAETLKVVFATTMSHAEETDNKSATVETDSSDSKPLSRDEAIKFLQSIPGDSEIRLLAPKSAEDCFPGYHPCEIGRAHV